MKKAVFLVMTLLATVALAGGDGPGNSTLDQQMICVVSDKRGTYKKDLIITYNYKKISSQYSYNSIYKGTVDIKIAAGDSAKSFPLNYRLLIDAKGIPFNTLADKQNVRLSGPWAKLTGEDSSRFIIYGSGWGISRSLDYWHQEKDGSVSSVVSFRLEDNGSCATKQR